MSNTKIVQNQKITYSLLNSLKCLAKGPRDWDH